MSAHSHRNQSWSLYDIEFVKSFLHLSKPAWLSFTPAGRYIAPCKSINFNNLTIDTYVKQCSVGLTSLQEQKK